MKSGFTKNLKNLQKLYLDYNVDSGTQKIRQIQILQKNKFPENKLLEIYHSILLFICAHPDNVQILKLATSELSRISRFLKNKKTGLKSKWQNTGLPYTEIHSEFSLELIKWMLDQKIVLTLNSITDKDSEFKSFLSVSLPDIEKELSHVCESMDDFTTELNLKQKNILPFLISQFDRLKNTPQIQDYFYNSLGLLYTLKINHPGISKSFNHLNLKKWFYHDQIRKKFDSSELIKQTLPNEIKLNSLQRQELIRVCKLTLILLQRETEPVSYMDEKSIRYFQLDRGVSVAIYTPVAERQLPIESYVGYTLFRNGYPAAYGGAWILGPCALFGINIFDWCRGGESGYMLCQLLRVFHQYFQVSHFEVEPYQYGLNNPEGIETGAFWFYYKFGFRPVSQSLKKLADLENRNIKSKINYRSSKKNLKKFTDSNIELNLSLTKVLAMWQVRSRVSLMIDKKYQGNRAKAEIECVEYFIKNSKKKIEFSVQEKRVLADFALITTAFQLKSRGLYDLMLEMIQLKPRDVYKYQKLMHKFYKLLVNASANSKKWYI